ncbi:hypothetical protein L6259_01455 [Candidatus Parcubacteria bacterium]|nr:hypothetical protein [Patescibacteria group bacterium]MCG2693931.1 hypothetical protein [Candidatus Parcubacteria bacterium]
MPKPTIKQVYFDLGHVVIDVDKEAVARALAPHSELGFSGLMKIFGKGYTNFEREFWDIVCEFDRGNLHPHEFHNKIKRVLKLKIGFKAFEGAWQSMLVLDKRFIKLVCELKRQGIGTGIISDLCVIHYNRFREMVPYRGLFDNWFFSYQHGLLKRDRDGMIFEAAIRACRIQDPSQIVFVDDLEINIKYASGYGLSTFQYRSDFIELLDFLASFEFYMRL